MLYEVITVGTLLNAILNPTSGTTEDSIVAFDGMIFFEGKEQGLRKNDERNMPVYLPLIGEPCFPTFLGTVYTGC